MEKMKTTAVQSTPPTAKSEQSATGRSNFLMLALNMSWQLAIVVIVPIIAGVQIDKATHTHNVYTLVGLALAVLGSIVVMWRTMQVANSLPVPKLTAAQKREIQKQYEEDDADV